MKHGKFIAFEGGEGAGKSTQACLLASALEERGIPSVQTREPGGTDGAEAIRALLLDPPGEEWGARAEALLFAAARSDHVERLINPALDAGKWVICDRFVDSSRAYQGGAGGVGVDQIDQLHRIGSAGKLPDVTFLLQTSPADVTARLNARDGDQSDAIGGRSGAYHDAVASAFNELAQRDSERFVIIDGSASVETVHTHIMRAIAERFDV